LPNLLSESELALATPEEQAEYLSLLERLELAHEQEQLSDLASFSRAAWKVLEPSTPLIWNWHLDLICEYLTLARDRVIRRLIINVPPQTSKSRFVTTFYPCWTWVTVPSRRFMAVSYSGGPSGLSTQHSIDRRRILQSEWFQQTFPDRVKFADDQNQKQQYENLAGGRMIATSTGGTATGKGVHDIILDDLINPKEADSEAERTAATNFLDTTIRTRLSDQITGVIIIVEQRTHEMDPTGHVMMKEPGVWTQIRLPMEAEEEERWVFPISGRVVERKKGELLWPERFPKNVTASLKIGLGGRAYAGQYQQRPTPAEGTIIKRQWLRYWKVLPEKFDQVAFSLDCAFKDTKGSSRVCLSVYGRIGARKLLLDQVCDHMDFVETQRAMVSMTANHPEAVAKWVEDKANGAAIISSLKAKIPGLIAVEPDGSKEARMYAVSPEYEAGNVEYPDPNMPGFAWVHEHVEEILRFPNEPNDRGDAESQALNELRKSHNAFMGWLQKDADKRKADAANAEKVTKEAQNLSSLLTGRRS
jgi:predicted phage terminase large subunit-like protein